MKKPVCPRCGEYADHEYGQTYSCSVCQIVYMWKPVRNGKKIVWVPVFRTEESIEKVK